MSAIYGAAGVVHDPALTALLLEAGADPDAAESLYHATEASDPAGDDAAALLAQLGVSTQHACERLGARELTVLDDAGRVRCVSIAPARVACLL